MQCNEWHALAQRVFRNEAEQHTLFVVVGAMFGEIVRSDAIEHDARHAKQEHRARFALWNMRHNACVAPEN